jgi:hypothetical protein
MIDRSAQIPARAHNYEAVSEAPSNDNPDTQLISSTPIGLGSDTAQSGGDPSQRVVERGAALQGAGWRLELAANGLANCPAFGTQGLAPSQAVTG